MKSYMFMLQRRVIKYSLLLLKLAVMPHHSYPLSFRCLDSAMSEQQGRLRAVGLGSRERRGFKTSFDTLTLTNYSKELLYHL